MFALVAKTEGEPEWGVGILNAYLRAAEDEQQPGADRQTKKKTLSVYDAARAPNNELFDPQPDAACLRAHYKALCQGLDQLVVEGIEKVRRVAELCEFGMAGDVLAFDQIVSGITSPHLQRTFFRMGKDFLQKALGVASEGERVEHALQQLSGAQVDAVYIASDARWRLCSPNYSRCHAKWRPSTPSFSARWRRRDFSCVLLLALRCCVLLVKRRFSAVSSVL
ncbi:hypothetical protein HPB51_005808 [Rhipicephalus microplus]|uniref:Uncharacterized protein n=1 Tax=Rhipicephalus microplus TaxID=6941 RepID=A0A9J6EQK4_RHIMP|nr:hypothetical protein HPB51_005808 [Rhipicephalus microplus]